MAQRGTQVPADESACNQLQQSQISTSHTSRTDYPGFNSHTDLIFRSQVRKLSTLLRPLPMKLVTQPQSLQFQRSSQDKRLVPHLGCTAEQYFLYTSSPHSATTQKQRKINEDRKVFVCQNSINIPSPLLCSGYFRMQTDSIVYQVSHFRHRRSLPQNKAM